MQRTAGQFASERWSFTFRTLALWALAFAGYVLTLQFVYPKFFAPFSPFHGDMYIAVDLAARGLRPIDALFQSRPISLLIGLFGGYLGVEGSLVVFAAVTLLAIALSVAVAERCLLRTRIPWWLALATMMFAMAGPSFYAVPGNDNGTPIAMIFGLLGMYCWETRVRARTAFAAAALFFCLSTLSKEGFLPVIGVYAIVAAYRARSSRRLMIASLALPVIAFAAAFFDSQFFHSPYVNLGSGTPGPYAVSLNPVRVLGTFWYYFSAIVNVWVLGFLALCCLGAWLQHRGREAAFVVAASLAAYLPYAMLPNHRLGYYAWVPMPIVMLLIPLAWIRNPAAQDGAPALSPARRTALVQFTRVALAVSFFFALQSLSAINMEGGAWTIQQQSINRNVLRGIRLAESQTAVSKSVLVCGLSFAFHPWHHGEFLADNLRPGGMWTIATHAPGAPIGPQPHTQPIAYEAIHWRDYDLVLIFDGGGQLVGTYRPSEIEALSKRLHLDRGSPLDVIMALRNGTAVIR